MTTVVLPGVLRQHADGAGTVDVELATGATVGDLLDELARRHPALARRVRDERGELRRFVNVYVDGTDARADGGLAAPVPTGAEVLILPSIAGG
ncbi:MAG TPA: ubiquitin-like small modifier protein 1 [Jatrophihabitantaceae bacterium]|jgi:molybdopterin converting factor small subunit|nr:ubiquitin-like small modifier protein 1 [Jatrophihabitantaceae bacterium]